MKNKTSVLLLCVLMLAGCGPSSYQVAADAKMKNPDILNEGTYDGCVVKFVDRGYPTNSFFIARCDQTVTSTSNYEVSHGKSSSLERSVVISNQIATLTAEQKQLARDAALAKLTPEERKALLGEATP